MTKTIDYKYDHLNRPIARIEDVDGATGSAAIENEYFLHDGDDVVARYTKVGTGPVTLKNRYLWGPQVDQLPADEQISSGTSGTVYWALTDHLGQTPYDAGLDLCRRLNLPLPSASSPIGFREEAPVPNSDSCRTIDSAEHVRSAFSS